MELILDILGRFVPMIILLVVCAGVLVGFVFVALKAATENVDLIKGPIIPFVVLYCIAIDLPLLGADDLFNLTGIDANNEILKIVIMGIPFFCFVIWRLMCKGVPMMWAIVYSAACWAAGIAAALGMITMLIIIGTIIFTLVTGGSLVKEATEEGPVAMRKCPNCKQGIPYGDSYCPHCGIEVG